MHHAQCSQVVNCSKQTRRDERGTIYNNTARLSAVTIFIFNTKIKIKTTSTQVFKTREQKDEAIQQFHDMYGLHLKKKIVRQTSQVASLSDMVVSCEGITCLLARSPWLSTSPRTVYYKPLHCTRYFAPPIKCFLFYLIERFSAQAFSGFFFKRPWRPV